MGSSDSKEEGRSPRQRTVYVPVVPIRPPQQPTYGGGYERQGSHETRYANPAPQLVYPPAPSQVSKKFAPIADNYSSLDQVTKALSEAGLESSNLIIGIDFTKSNEWTGKKSLNGKSLHHTGDVPNPYQQAIAIVGKTLADFDEDNLIPCYGFGDASTHDQHVFSFYPDDRFCNGFEEVLGRYKEIVPQLRLSGPTSFAPIIDMATTIVQNSNGQYHVLVIVADGQVTASPDSARGRLSPQEKKTIDALVEASKYPLSIILVGVGDGPWDMMKEFDDNIPARAFDNFQFVNFTEIMSKNTAPARKETEFALAALMEIPSQYKATIELNLLGNRNGNASPRVPLPPPVGAKSLNRTRSSVEPSTSRHTNIASFASFNFPHTSPLQTAASAPSSSLDNQACPNCHRNPKGMAFNCGHQTCCECGKRLQLCPMCHKMIYSRIKLY